ncbi:GrpE protein-like protein 2, mitochondrial [Aphelenchoides fujianensis]|nr:GrpE protein-like protein 2, mitochondrial [Aphelenchoides fujianensis]
MSWCGPMRRFVLPTASRASTRPPRPKVKRKKKIPEEIREKYRQALATSEALTEENEELRDKFRRALAETENVRRRGQKQLEDAKSFAIQSFCKDLLEVADVLNLAVDSVDKTTLQSDSQLKNIYDGVVMTKDVLHKVLSKHGLSVVTPEGQKFDPNFHDAIYQVPAKDSKF